MAQSSPSLLARSAGQLHDRLSRHRAHAQRPAILHALVLHMIKHDRHRAALDELETCVATSPGAI
jgi:hypothetical protein